MNPLPPIPSWNALHPLVIHFPIALLLVAPVFLLAGLVVPRAARPLMVAAWVLMALGTAAAFVAVGSGEAARRAADVVPQVDAVIARHAAFAGTTRTIFTVLTLVCGALLVALNLARRPLPVPARTVTVLTFLALYAGGVLVLIHTAHQGGRLVHAFGVRAVVAPEDEPLPEISGAGAESSETPGPHE